MYLRSLFPIFLLLILSFSKSENERFQYYKPISKTQEIEVLYLTWEDTNLPNFVKVSDYKKFGDKAELIEYCFYVDSKDPEKRKFKIPVTTDKLIKKIPLKIKGKFYKTKQFDDTFPTPLFEDLRKTGYLKFKPKNDEFLVFVLD
ncbi:hypothetical protein [Chryseobacterium sp. SC28]|uniref:hypothetical protein n=1 Tax=Chryseobacterium sp. SC28 TaxID=2268028 RepID=UPI000F646707|nr:hypothetical protein [Chryseobacterium sp. SC28]RRQ46031.1 hypothetical protein DTW91_07050 [Chryseobacterium sp. SC28]